MEDVRTAVARAYRFQLIAVVAIGVLAAPLRPARLRHRVRSCPSRSREAPCSRSSSQSSSASLQPTSYGSFEEPFHWLFFEGETWRFEETDTLRRLYPDRFWLDTAIVIGVLCRAPGDPALRRGALLGPACRGSPTAADAGANGGHVTSRAVDRFLPSLAPGSRRGRSRATGATSTTSRRGPARTRPAPRERRSSSTSRS